MQEATRSHGACSMRMPLLQVVVALKAVPEMV